MVAKREHCMEREPLPKNLKKSRNSDQELKAKEEAFQGEEAFQLLQETSKKLLRGSIWQTRENQGQGRDTRGRLSTQKRLKRRRTKGKS